PPPRWSTRPGKRAPARRRLGSLQRRLPPHAFLHRPHLHGAVAHDGHLGRPVQRHVEAPGLQQVEAEQVLLGLGERPVGEQPLPVAQPDRGGRVRPGELLRAEQHPLLLDGRRVVQPVPDYPVGSRARVLAGARHGVDQQRVLHRGLPVLRCGRRCRRPGSRVQRTPVAQIDSPGPRFAPGRARRRCGLAPGGWLPLFWWHAALRHPCLVAVLGRSPKRYALRAVRRTARLSCLACSFPGGSPTRAARSKEGRARREVTVGAKEIRGVGAPGPELPRMLSGDGPTGRLHLGHYVGSLANRIRLHRRYQSFFIIADLHMLTTKNSPADIAEAGRHAADMVLDSLAAGLDPAHSVFYLQSAIPEVAELSLLLSSLVTVPRLQRIPSLKEMSRDAAQREMPFALLGYPLLQAADILAVRATAVPVGGDNAAH